MASTRDDVARLAGVSPAVVSYVTNDGPRPVAAATRERVLEAIEQLDYRPDGVARDLRRGRTDSLGLVLPDIGQPYFAEITHALSRMARAADRQLLIATTDWDLDVERRHLRALAQRRVDGVILMSVDPAQDFDALVGSELPIVVVDRPWFANHAVTIATEHLLGHGHRRIGFVGGESHWVAMTRRRDAWESAMRRAGASVVEDYQVAAPLTRQGGYDAIVRLLDLPEPPTAVFVETDAQAVGVLRAAADRWVAVPDDLAVVTADGTELARFTVPSLTTVEQPIETIAREAMNGVTRDLRSGGLRRVDNETAELVVRESCGCIPR